MKKIIPYILLLTCCSCATIMNRRSVRIAVVTTTPVRVVIAKDTFTRIGNKVVLRVPRKMVPLEIRVFNDTVSKKITIVPLNSAAYWFNIYATWGIGMLVDKNSSKRYTYPKKVLVTMTRSMPDSFTLKLVPEKINERRNIIKITPLRFLLSHPGIELSYERYIGNRFSVQASWARLYDIEWDSPSGEGYQLSLEGKYFDIQRVKRIAPYVSLEAGYFDIMMPGNKRIQYLIPKLGVQFGANSRLMADVYLGVGVKHQMGEDETTFGIATATSSDFWDLRIATNVKIGWRF
jgi:hypothetical protein